MEGSSALQPALQRLLQKDWGLSGTPRSETPSAKPLEPFSLGGCKAGRHGASCAARVRHAWNAEPAEGLREVQGHLVLQRGLPARRLESAAQGGVRRRGPAGLRLLCCDGCVVVDGHRVGSKRAQQAQQGAAQRGKGGGAGGRRPANSPPAVAVHRGGEARGHASRVWERRGGPRSGAGRAAQEGDELLPPGRTRGPQ